MGSKIMKKIKKPKAVSEFRDFVLRGNIIDMAVGVIIGGAFGKIVASLVDDIIMPAVGMLLGGVNFESLAATVGGAELKYGIFVQRLIDFLIIALCMFLFVKLVAKLKAMREKFEKKEEQEETAAVPEKSDEVKLLEEIRDALKKK